ncbi:MAG: hypothetical protein IJ523_05305 [Succinivibrionaceae bacterium]|nr:hypothetical protein [Succinivibrionaceae bacterium]
MNFKRILSLTALAAAVSLAPAEGAFALDYDVTADKPADGKTFAIDGVDFMLKSYDRLHNCLLRYKSLSGVQVLKVENVGECESDLRNFKTSRLNFARQSKLMFGNEQERKQVMADGEYLDKVHDEMVKLSEMFIGFGKKSSYDSPLKKTVGWINSLDDWGREHEKKYISQLKQIDKQLGNFKAAASRCRNMGDHYECSRSALNGLESAAKVLGQYFTYDTETKRVRGVGSGAFLHDLDSHTRFLKFNDIDKHRNSLNAVRAFFQSGSITVSKQIKTLYDMAEGKRPTIFAEFISVHDFPFKILQLSDEFRDFSVEMLKFFGTLPEMSYWNLISHSPQKLGLNHIRYDETDNLSYLNSIKQFCDKNVLKVKDTNGNIVNFSISVSRKALL